MATVNIKVETEPSGAYDLSLDLTRQQGGVDDASSTITSVRADTRSALQGMTVESIDRALYRYQVKADDLSSGMSALASALDTFASSMSSVKQKLQQARDDAESAGLRISGDTIHSPDSSDPDYASRQKKFTSISEDVEKARKDESDAHDALTSACRELTASGTEKLIIFGASAIDRTDTALGWAEALTKALHPQLRWLHLEAAAKFFTKAGPPLKALSRLSSIATGVTSAFDQYHEDSDRFPSMGENKKVLRAVADGLLVGSAALAGEAVGSTVGALVAPATGAAAPVTVFALSELGNSLGTKVGETVSHVALEHGGEIARFQGRVEDALADLTADALEETGAVRSAAGNIVADVADAAGDTAKDSAYKAADGAAAAGDSASRDAYRAGDTARHAGDVAGDRIEGPAGDLVRGLTHMTGGVLDFYGDALSTAGDTASDMLRYTGDATDCATDTVSDVVRGVSNAAARADSITADMIRDAGDFVRDVGDAADKDWFS